MVRYLALLKFTEQGAKNLKTSTKRAKAFRDTAAQQGVQVEAQLWTTGVYDGALLFKAKDEESAVLCLSALAAAGNVRTESLRAFDADEFTAFTKSL
jgi:uncharacterized protein with GYD domain